MPRYPFQPVRSISLWDSPWSFGYSVTENNVQTARLRKNRVELLVGLWNVAYVSGR